jgi:signal transduction histidine kinase
VAPATVFVIGEPDAIRPYVEELSAQWLTIGRGTALGARVAEIPANRSEDVVVELARDGTCVVRLGQESTRLGVWPSPSDLAALVALVARLAELDRQLRVMEEMEPLGVLACSTAHDVNNLLLVVLASLGELARTAPEKRELSAALPNAEAAARKIAVLMRRMLSFGRDGAARPIDLNTAVIELLPTLRSVVGPGIVIREVLSSATPMLRSDVIAIERILINLCANARDALPLGGSVVISTRVEAPPTEPSAASEGEAGGWVILEVRDDGTGMLPETLARVFEPLFTTKSPERGTGLGLKSVRRIVSRAGGSCQIESKPGEGTSVTLRWPAQA